MTGPALAAGPVSLRCMAGDAGASAAELSEMCLALKAEFAVAYPALEVGIVATDATMWQGRLNFALVFSRKGPQSLAGQLYWTQGEETELASMSHGPEIGSRIADSGIRPAHYRSLARAIISQSDPPL